MADVRTVVRWFFEETNQRVILLGISIGGTFAVRAAENEPEHIRAIVAVSPDSHMAAGDAAADAFIRTGSSTHAAGRERGHVFGANDALNPPALVNHLPVATAAPATTVTVVPDGGHFVHFDHPQAVRSVVANA